MIEAYVGLGSNLKNPEQQVKQAQISIAEKPEIQMLNCSSLYSSPPMGPQDQPDYVNAVMQIETALPAIDLLRVLQRIENDFGRVRKDERWGARTLDLDLLLYADQQIDITDLVVPHVGISERAFVLCPLAEIAPDDLYIPGRGLLLDLLEACPLDGLEKLVA